MIKPHSTHEQETEIISQILDTGESPKIDYSQTNGLSQTDESDDEYVDPFDIQNELCESLQRNTDILKQVQNTIVRMNSDMSSILQRMVHLERTLGEVKHEVLKRKCLGQYAATRKYPEWWPFSDISPIWFILLVLWPFIARRVDRLFKTLKQH